MFRIRKEQVEALDKAAFQAFEERVAEHVKESFPKHAELCGEEAVRKVVRIGLERAQEYGIAKEGGLQLYIDLMFLLGSSFDTDPQLPWAAEVLSDTSIEESARLDRLFEHANDYMDEVSGPNNEFIDEAQGRILEESRRKVPREALSNLEGYLAGRLKFIFPEKCRYIGDDCLQAIVALGMDRAREQGLGTERGVLVLIGLKFMLGAGADEDPQFPWVSEILNDSSLDVRERSDRLFEAATDFLKKWCAR